tara:strand:+ start:2815 stop:3126 length:312 start_codon:yes stop_codon:yes gene_type:complete
MANINQLMKQAQQMQSKMATAQKELEAREVEASSGGGMVKVRVNGKQELLEINIDKECVDPNDVEMLEELVKTAINQAVNESQEMVSKAMSKITGGLNIPGMF